MRRRYETVRAVDDISFSIDDGELRVERAETTRTGARLLAEQLVADVNIAEPPIEEIISEVFAARAGPAPAGE